MKGNMKGRKRMRRGGEGKKGWWWGRVEKIKCVWW